MSTLMQTNNDYSATTSRVVVQQLPGMATADGDGVKLTRIIGTPHL